MSVGVCLSHGVGHSVTDVCGRLSHGVGHTVSLMHVPRLSHGVGHTVSMMSVRPTQLTPTQFNFVSLMHV